MNNRLPHDHSYSDMDGFMLCLTNDYLLLHISYLLTLHILPNEWCNNTRPFSDSMQEMLLHIISLEYSCKFCVGFNLCLYIFVFPDVTNLEAFFIAIALVNPAGSVVKVTDLRGYRIQLKKEKTRFAFFVLW